MIVPLNFVCYCNAKNYKTYYTTIQSNSCKRWWLWVSFWVGEALVLSGPRLTCRVSLQLPGFVVYEREPSWQHPLGPKTSPEGNSMKMLKSWNRKFQHVPSSATRIWIDWRQHIFINTTHILVEPSELWVSKCSEFYNMLYRSSLRSPSA